MTKSHALERCRELFGEDVNVTSWRIPSATPGRYFETVRHIHRPRTGETLGRSLLSWEQAIANAEKRVAATA
jgi:hypothetical protein